MPTIVDEFVVTLGLDPKKFDEGQRKAFEALRNMQGAADRAEQKSHKERQDRYRQQSQALASVAKQAVGLFAILAGANSIKDFAVKTFENNLQLGLMAKNLNVGVNVLSKWAGVAEMAGGKAADATTAFNVMNEGLLQLQNFATLGEATPFWRRLGINGKEDLNDYEQALFKIAQAAKDLADSGPTGRRDAMFAMDQIGIPTGLANALVKGPDDLRRELAKIKGITDADVDAAEKLHKKVIELRKAIERLGTDALLPLVPVLEGMLGNFLEIAGVIQNLNWPKATKAGEDLAVALGHVNDALARMGTSLGPSTTNPLQQFFSWAVAQVKALAAGFEVIADVLSGDWAAARKHAVEFREASQSYLNDDGSATTSPPGAPIPEGVVRIVPGSNLDAAVRTLVGEASTERGQMDVAHVIMNRMAEKKASAKDIVFSSAQFEPWMNEERRKYLLGLDPNGPEMQQAYRSWTKAGREPDRTKGATLFYSPSANAAAKDGRQVHPDFAVPANMTMEYGGHQFFTGGFNDPSGSSASRAYMARYGTGAAGPSAAATAASGGKKEAPVRFVTYNLGGIQMKFDAKGMLEYPEDFGKRSGNAVVDAINASANGGLF